MTNKQGHTPGPWKAIPEHLSDSGFHIAGRSPYVLAGHSLIAEIARSMTTAGLDNNAEANARLIAAAPDLLAALEAITEIATRRWRSLPPDGHEKQTLGIARAAIAKAKGE